MVIMIMEGERGGKTTPRKEWKDERKDTEEGRTGGRTQVIKKVRN